MLYDISIPISAATPPWPGDTPFSCGWTCRREDGDSVNLGTITTSAHVGTHADAPLHVHSGWGASETLPLHVFLGDAELIALPTDHPPEAPITAALLEQLLVEPLTTRVLMRTGHSIAHGAFPDVWPALSEDATQWLLARGVVLWGTDAPSVDPRTSTTLPVHHALFSGGAFLLENLALRAVPVGRYELLAPPLAIHGADAAPVRAVLRARG